MAALREIALGTLVWTQPKRGQRSYVLGHRDRQIASLSFPSMLGSRAEADADGTGYVFERSGVFRPKVIITKSPFDQEVGRMEMSLKGNGSVEMFNGRRYALEKKSIWKNRWDLINEQGEVLASMTVHPRLTRYEGEVTIEEKGRKDDTTVMLLTLSWYIILLMMREGGASAAAVGGS
ncbi:MAG: hypothetical protein ISF22_07265 [Methanomassiliicoccus sp.]|nr:hypothetical protein [Methanomassiliicoccus sp.]